MVQDYTEFKEEETQLKLHDRVICHGNNTNINFEGQTGIITKVVLYGKIEVYTIFFDNLFSKNLNCMDSKSKRYYNLYGKYVKKMKIPVSKQPLTRFSERIKKILEYIDYMSYPYRLDINYIDVGEGQNHITYLSNSRVARLKDGEDPYKSSLRDNMAIGKFLKKLNSYSDNVNIERKVNIYKAMYDNFISDKKTFKMVQGLDVIEWYQEKRYFHGSGPLNNSCMKNHFDKLLLYNDPSRVAMLILTSPDDKLLGRALVWNVTEPDITYMDRVYTVFPEDEAKFYIFADENGWYNYKDHIKDNEQALEMIIRYNYEIGDQYENPYMDTFKIFVNHRGKHGNYYLTSVDDQGDYIELEETESESDEYYDD